MNSPLVIIILLILGLIQRGLSYLPFNGYELRDLNATGSCFITQINTWNILNPKTDARYTVCDDDYILGGFDILRLPSDYFSRNYNGLPSHNMIYYTMTVWAVDSWDADPLGTTGDYFIVDFGGVQSNGPHIPVSIFPKQSCGTLNWKDLGPIRIFGKVPHIGNTLNLNMLSAFNEYSNNESFGFRDLNLLFVLNPDPALLESSTLSLCALAPITIPNKECSCPEGKYHSNSATCTSCHPACASCFGPGPNHCYQCASGASFVQDSCIFCHASCELCRGPGPADCITCKSDLYFYQSMCVPECPPPSIQTTDGCINSCSAPCSSPTTFLYWNWTCQATCNFPLHRFTDSNSIQRCIYPCGTGEYLYWDGSCQQNCPSILSTRVEIDVRYCDYPCTDSQFLYWNGTCLTTCAPPLVQVFDKGKQFCNYPCSSNEFLNFDGSCLSSCDPPFLSSTITSKKYCTHPCTNTSLFVYWDNSCQQSCLPPLQEMILPSLLSCVPICQPGQYILWNGSCIEECNPPSVIQNVYYGNKCILPCTNPFDYYYEDLDLCKSTCDSYSVIVDNLYFKCLTSPSALTSGLLIDLFLTMSSNSERISFHSVNKLIQPLKYLDITFPPRVQAFLSNKGKSIILLIFGTKMSRDIQKHFIDKELFGPFINKNLHSSFLVNFWPTLTTLWIILGIGIIIYVFKIISKMLGWSFIYEFCKNICFVPILNFPLVLFLTNIGDIILFSYLEFKTFEGDSTANILSLLICILILFGLLLILLGSLYLSIRSQSLKEKNLSKSDHNYQKFLNKWENCQVLFRGYNKGRLYGNYFYFFYILRLALPMIIAASHSTPLLQTILYIIINIISIAYICVARPIKSKINFCQIIIVEGILFTINFSAFMLTIFKMFSNEESEIDVYFGDIIILGNLLLNFLLVVFLGFKVFLGVQDALIYKKRNDAKRERIAWFSLFFLPIQQGGAGFEQAKPIETINVNEPKVYNIVVSQKNLNSKNGSKIFSEKSLADTTRIESSLQETNPMRKPNQAPYDMNEEIITFAESEAVWNSSQVSLPTVEEHQASDAFPIQKIVKKSHFSHKFD